ncbi:TPA: ATP synthase F1 subunit epsilon [Candidatus Berkelbacteria bacterium]|uniref:ATP synthase epsilon chain n=1 Tax=Berkelbacteria bacterium GW2011_GWE1_39_12 TaxID=1618337 RepID=A0A0G4B2W2_9BACT|nr:MAG: F0F1 ATP synthase subunit epsilon, F-type H+-transporting ATPase subunit epsilon [Berkelbacteria bacterium GW2011_GWE1_39_12]HBO60867.1 ATP synthase F1 subunit epsilon [Candidatus Berkelbacteria bacterium]
MTIYIMKLFDFKLITPEETIYEGKAHEVLLPTLNGEIGILAGHEPLVTILSPGEIIIRQLAEKGESEEIHLASMGGFVEINNDVVKVLSDSAVRSERIDEIAAEEAKNKAKQKLENAEDDIEVAEASAALEKALLHLKIANRQRKHR